LLPAMPNEQIRQLEYSMIELLPAPLPHVYVCSSQKEEFGIAVLEAMEAGFLVFGPGDRRSLQLHRDGNKRAS